MKALFPVHTRGNLVVSLVLAISMVGVSYGAGGNLPGDGTSESTAYLIEDLTDFYVFADQANAATYWASGVYTKLACDPNLAGRPYTIAVIAPDTSTSSGFQGTRFTGVFDGDGHIIRNLTIDTEGEGNNYLGLFGRIEGSSAEVKNLGLESVNITGGDYSCYLSGLCGYNNGTITNCYVAGSVIGGYGSHELGGLCGYNNGTITNCCAAGSVTGDEYLGGLCGYNSFGIITNCYATGSVTGNEYLGGLCGYNDDGTITNCYSSGSVTSRRNSNYLGGLCGRNSYGTITNCYATGLVTGGDDSYYLGGLCGHNSYGTITNCYATGLVTGNDRLGGLCGYNYNGTITNCYAAGSVNGDEYLGGLCGRNYHSTIINCYATGLVTGDKYLGGLCGHNYYGAITNCYATGSVTGGNNSGYLGGLCGRNKYGTITDCYATGSVNGGTGSYSLGGLCGSNYESTITNCFWDTQTSGMSVSDGGTGKTTAQMQMQSTFTNAGWDFTNETANGTSQIWQMPTGGGYPVLSSFDGYTPVLLSGNGTEANPYLINDTMELGAIYHYNSNACFRLQSDVNLTGIQWSTAIVPVFGGCFDGNGYVIYNLNIEGGGHLGLFGKISGSSAEVENLGIENINITGGAGSDSLGSLCGRNSYGTITNCYATGSVTGNDRLGGLCGYNDHGIITNCYATGSVTGNDRLGGLCGYNSSGTITNCYATGLVTGDDNIGGLCGRNYGTITNCFWDTETSGLAYSSGGTPKTTAEMQTESTFTDAGWDFSVVPVWRMPFQVVGYPMLGWQRDIPGDFTGGYGVDLADFVVLADTWMLSTGEVDYNDKCDLADNDTIDINDLAVFAENWLSR